MIDVQDLVRPEAINGRAYTDPDIYQLELTKLFTNGWVFVGHESEVPRTGDYVTRRLGHDPVIMVRDRAGQIHVVANRRAHRGVSLVQGREGNVGSFQCIFHGWTYGHDGTLKGMPQSGGLALAKEDCSLDRPGQVANYRGFVFANQSGMAGTLADHLGPGGIELLDWVCDLSPTGQVDLTAGWLGQEAAPNWKMWAESDLDGYHLERCTRHFSGRCPAASTKRRCSPAKPRSRPPLATADGGTSSSSSGAGMTDNSPGSA